MKLLPFGGRGVRRCDDGLDDVVVLVDGRCIGLHGGELSRKRVFIIRAYVVQHQHTRVEHLRRRRARLFLRPSIRQVKVHQDESMVRTRRGSGVGPGDRDPLLQVLWEENEVDLVVDGLVFDWASSRRCPTHVVRWLARWRNSELVTASPFSWQNSTRR